MKVYSKTRKSHYWNEDRFINGRNYFIVLDGATPLKSAENFNEARWMVNYIKKNINRYRGTVKEKLTALCGDAFNDLPVKTKDDDYLPSASGCWVEFNGSCINVGILGDCEVTLIKKDNGIIRCYCDDLTKLDMLALNKLIEICKEKNTHIIESRKYVNDILIRHRKLANKPNGYAALTLSPSPEIHEQKYVFNTDNIKEIYLYSDGFSQAFEHLDIFHSHEEMFLNIEDIDNEINKIVNTSFADRLGDKHPRFKIIDDITVTRIVL